MKMLKKLFEFRSCLSEFRSCVKVEVAVLGSPSLIVRTVSVDLVRVQCRFTSTETRQTVRDGEPRTATSTFTQLLMYSNTERLSRCAVFCTRLCCRRQPAAREVLCVTALCEHTPCIAFRQLPPNSARIGYATKRAQFISVQLSTDAVSDPRKVWVAY